MELEEFNKIVDICHTTVVSFGLNEHGESIRNEHYLTGPELLEILAKEFGFTLFEGTE
jgi:hypothetical protein